MCKKCRNRVTRGNLTQNAEDFARAMLIAVTFVALLFLFLVTVQKHVEHETKCEENPCLHFLWTN
jgi:hypothetical protein